MSFNLNDKAPLPVEGFAFPAAVFAVGILVVLVWFLQSRATAREAQTAPTQVVGIDMNRVALGKRRHAERTGPAGDARSRPQGNFEGDSEFDFVGSNFGSGSPYNERHSTSMLGVQIGDAHHDASVSVAGAATGCGSVQAGHEASGPTSHHADPCHSSNHHDADDGHDYDGHDYDGHASDFYDHGDCGSVGSGGSFGSF